VLLAALITMAATGPASAAQAPEQALRRADAALAALEGRGVTGDYLMTVRVQTKAPGEDGPENTLEVYRVTILPDGSKRTTLVRAVEDGRDVTEERRHEDEVEEHRGDDRDEVDIELLPVGRNAGLYTFKAPKIRDGVAVASYRPRVDVDDDELSRGEVAWDVASGDPLWIEAKPVNDPPFVGDIAMRFEFARSGDVLHASHIATHVRAGIPLILRVKVDVEIELSEVRLQPRAASSEAVVPTS